jgi:hypothetical protein
MALFMLLPALALLCVILLAPLMLPGAVVVLIALGIAEVVRRHHPDRTIQAH